MKNNTLDKKEIEKFSKIAEEWWNPTGKFKPLHKFNPIRIKYIKDNLINDFNLINKKKEKKGIYGKASSQEVKELKNEGIETEVIPWINDKEN